MWTDPGWFIHQLEGRICFWSSGRTICNFLFLSFSTMYSSSLWRTDTIVFAKLNKPPPAFKQAPHHYLAPLPLICVWNKLAPGELNRDELYFEML